MITHRLYTVFIVEHNKMYSFMLMCKLFRNPKIEINSYSRAGQCIQFLNLKPDIIILDYKLLGTEALEVLGLIKERSPNTSVIILFEPDDNSIFPELKDDNYYDYVIKENDSTKFADKLIQKINNAIEIKEHRNILLKQRISLLGVGLIIILISIIIFFI